MFSFYKWGSRGRGDKLIIFGHQIWGQNHGLQNLLSIIFMMFITLLYFSPTKVYPKTSPWLSKERLYNLPFPTKKKFSFTKSLNKGNNELIACYIKGNNTVNILDLELFFQYFKVLCEKWTCLNWTKNLITYV